MLLFCAPIYFKSVGFSIAKYRIRFVLKHHNTIGRRFTYSPFHYCLPKPHVREHWSSVVNYETVCNKVENDISRF